MSTWVWIAVIGTGIGFLGGVFGKGGSAVASPLLLLAGLPPIAAVASPLPSTIPATLGAADRYRRAGMLDRRVVLYSLLAGGPATVVGAIATRWIGGTVLMTATELLLIGIGLRLLWNTHTHRTVVGPIAARISSTPELLAVGAAVGLAGGLLANSGGFLLAPLYLSVLRLPIKPALGTSLAVSAVLAVPSTIVHASLGHINWAVAAVLAASALPAAQLGARISLRAAPARLEAVFGLFLVGLGLVTLLV